MLDNLKNELKKAEEHLNNEFAKLQIGRANPAVLDGILISAYGATQPLKNIASVGVLDPQTLSIEPWDKGLIREIDKAITEANLGFNPQNNGQSIMIKIPPVTEERRKDLVKFAKKLTEDAKVSVRNIRQDYLKKIKKAETDKEISEDIAKDSETNLQKQIDEAIKQIDEALKKKETDIMKV